MEWTRGRADKRKEDSHRRLLGSEVAESKELLRLQINVFLLGIRHKTDSDSEVDPGNELALRVTKLLRALSLKSGGS